MPVVPLMAKIPPKMAVNREIARAVVTWIVT